MKNIDIYTDGSFYAKKKKGGWAAVLISGNTKLEIGGPLEDVKSSSEAEMLAVINALSHIKTPSRIRIYTDSAFIVNAFDENIRKWKKKEWKNSKGEKVSYRNLWKSIIRLSSPHFIKFIHVSAHSGDTFNERCDEFAKVKAKSLILEESN